MRKTAAGIFGISGCLVAAVLVAPRAAADPITDDVCTGFRLGMSQSEIAQRLQRNDGRINTWQAWRDTNWPIIDGDCDT